MIKTIIFDLGGVLIKHQSDLMPRIVQSVFTIPRDEADEIWQENKNLILTGELPSKQFLDKIRNSLGSKTALSKLGKRWKSEYEREARQINDPLLSVIDHLRGKYRVYVLTDTLEVHHEINLKRGLYDHFDGVYASHIAGKSKSEGVGTFRHFLSTYSLRAEECVFVDDMEAYVDLAKTLGIRGVVFTSNDALTADLKNLGIAYA